MTRLQQPSACGSREDWKLKDVFVAIAEHQPQTCRSKILKVDSQKMKSERESGIKYWGPSRFDELNGSNGP
jgi:hypothetical protein